MTIDDHLVATLRTWKAQEVAERLSWGVAYADSDGAVFTSEDGRRVQLDYVTKLIGLLERERCLGA